MSSRNSQSSLKFGAFLLASLVVAYGLLMLVIRLHMTQLAYGFEELKSYERSLREEHVKLRAELAEFLSTKKDDFAAYHEPRPDQVIVIP